MQAIPTHPAAAAGNRTSLALFAPAMVFLAIAAARIVYVSLYAAPIPFWDQWDELNQQLRPLLDGTWHFTDLFAAHNEHRVLFTRLISFALLASNEGVFDNLVECYANAGLYAGLWALIYALLVHGDTERWRRGLLLVAVIALGSLPFDWENILVGFQNQFHFMELAAVALIGITAYRPPSRGSLLAIMALGTASLFTMAAGLLALPAVCIVALLRTRKEKGLSVFFVWVLTTMLVGASIGLALIPHVAADKLFSAVGLREHARALAIAAMWPMRLSSPASSVGYREIAFACFVWMPTAIYACLVLRPTRVDRNDLFTLGLAIWVLLQFIAIAHARGHGMNNLTWRYAEIPAIGIVCNFWLALKISARVKRKYQVSAYVLVLLGTCLMAWTFWNRTPFDLGAMQQRHQFSLMETWYVSRGLAGYTLPDSMAATERLPYPSAARLQQFIDMPDLRSLLAPSLWLHKQDSPRHAPLSEAASSLQHFVQTTLGAANHPSGIGTFSPRAGLKRPSATPGYCHLDQITTDNSPQAEAAAHVGSLVSFTGWVLSSRRVAPRRFSLELASPEQSYALIADTNRARPDVAQAMKSKAAMESGYSVIAELSSIRPGLYQIILSAPGTPEILCDTGKTLRIVR